MKSHKTPIILIIFNRVFERIKLAQPSQLFIAADGPRADRPEENHLCSRARSIVSQVDWPCEVHTLFREKNHGCKEAVSSAISWFFENVEEGIILEDDCLPDLSFYKFCDELLRYYKSDDRIGMISGNSFLEVSKISDSYHFSNFPHAWGWATWRRVWKKYDPSMKYWPILQETRLLLDKTGSEYYAQKWKDIFDRIHKGEIDTWDYQFVYTLWTQNQLSIIPTVNLVSNIGFGLQSTHTKNPNHKSSNIPANEIRFPLLHPQLVIRNIEKDNEDLIYNFGTMPTRFSETKKRMKKFLRRIVKK
jgi:hypothetical protein